MARRRRTKDPFTELQEIPVVGPYTGDDQRGGRRVYTRQEVRDQKRLIAQMLAQGLTPKQIHAAIERARDPTPLDGIRLARIQTLAKRVEDEWSREDEQERSKWKTRQIRRLHEELRVAMNGRKEGAAWVVKPNLAAAARFEELLAKVQGTLAPIEMKVDVHIAHAVQHVIADLSAEDVQEALGDFAEKSRLAREYEAMLKAGKVLTTPMGDEVLPAREEQSAKRTG